VQLEDVSVRQEDLLTEHGKGLECALQAGVPWFNVGTAAMAHGLCLAAVDATASHLQGTGFEHTGTGLRDLPNLRARLAEMSVATEQSRALLGHTLRELASPDAATPLWVLRTRMAGLQTAVQVTDLAMKACGGAAFSRHLGVERLFRDARAGDLAAALPRYRLLHPLLRWDSRTQFVQAIKLSMDVVGRYGGPCRPPRGPLDPSTAEAIRTATEAALRAEAEPAAVAG
jgi:hypothetical protein